MPSARLDASWAGRENQRTILLGNTMWSTGAGLADVIVMDIYFILDCILNTGPVLTHLTLTASLKGRCRKEPESSVT